MWNRRGLQANPMHPIHVVVKVPPELPSRAPTGLRNTFFSQMFEGFQPLKATTRRPLI